MSKTFPPITVIPSDVLSDLKRLQEISSTVNGKTALDDPRRQAGDDFCKLAVSVIETYGVSTKGLSVGLGMSPAALHLRLGRRGYGPLGESQTPVTAPGPSAPRRKKAECKWGHALVDGNLYFDSKGNRSCKTCAKARDRERVRSRRKTMRVAVSEEAARARIVAHLEECGGDYDLRYSASIQKLADGIMKELARG